MLRAFILGLGLVLPVQALALSCLPWHVEDAFLEADASADTFVIVTGRLELSADDLPKVDWDRQADVPPETTVQARLTGTALGRSGASAPFDEPLRLVVECAGPWCPQIESGAEYLAFVETSATPYELRTGPCGGMAFQDPDAGVLGRVQACLDGAGCTPPAR